MAKALIIKGADFSANKITTLVFGEIPCTGITLNSDSFSINSYDTVNAGYTVQPENTTDYVTWETSNSNIVTVENGVITPVGIGTCTITVRCGNFSDTATVNVSLAYIPSYVFGNIASQGTSPKEFLGITNSTNRITACGSGSQSGTYKCYGKDGADDQYIIKLPKNTASVTVKNTQKSYVYNGNYARFAFLTDESCEATGFTNYAKCISVETFNFNTTQEQTFNVPEGANACMFTVRTASSYTSGDNPATIMESMGFSLTFNAAAS